MYMSVDFDSLVPARPIGHSWLWSNSIGGAIWRQRVENTDRQEWVQGLTRELTRTTTMLWGAAYLGDEFAQSNLDTSRGMRAIGRDVRTSLPGVYWLNIFGPPYLDLIGNQRLLDAPAHSVESSGDHVVVCAYRDAEDWMANADTRHQLTAALGAEHFFDRNDPERHHRAPDFGLPRLSDKKPFQVMTTDGINFTPLP
jgi:hypothetical protein